MKAPFDDPSWEIWGVSARGDYVTRATRWFELHRLDGEPKDWADTWRETMKTFTHDVELLMLYPEPDLGPNVTTYPTERICARFSTYFMTSTFSWMMALAIDELRPLNGEPVEGQIGFWGVDMEGGTEYEDQRDGFRHFIDLARFAGIPITRLASSGLVYEPVPYPLWQDDPLLNKLEKRQSENDQRIKDFDETLRRTRTMMAESDAAYREIMAAQSPEYDADKRVAELRKEHAALMKTSAKISKDLVYCEGMKAELDWFTGYLK